MLYLFAFILLVLFFVAIIRYRYKYRQERISYKEAKRRIRSVHKAEKRNRKLEKYRTKKVSKVNRPEEEKPEASVEEDEFKDFLELAYKQTEKFASYSCKNDENLQYLLGEAFSSISKLTTLIDVNRYRNPEITEFYQVELDQFFAILGEEPIFVVDVWLSAKIERCLYSIRDKANRLGASIEEWKNFTKDVQIEALIEHMNG